MAEGIRRRHSRSCATRGGGRCNCSAGWEASVFSKRDGRKVRKTFARESEAKTWRADALVALTRGGLRASRPTTLDDAWEAWYSGAREGTVTNRSGDPYKPSALRSYERAMRLRVLPRFGSVKLADIHRVDLQEFADALRAEGKNASTVKVTFLPLRAVLGRAVAQGALVVNACDGLKLAAVRAGRERVASPEEAEALLAAAPRGDLAVWATALYGGLRRGELQALRAEDIDLGSGLIRVERGWDEKEGVIALKSRAGRRRVPIAPVLRDMLVEHRMTTPREGDELAFGRTAGSPFHAKSLQDRADRAWKAFSKAEREAAEEEEREPRTLTRITLHECRHTFASLMIAAGVNAKALQVFMGHSSIQVTFDLYGHLMPGSEAEAAALLDAYLVAQRERAEDAARGLGAWVSNPA
jgi:integrase